MDVVTLPGMPEDVKQALHNQAARNQQEAQKRAAKPKPARKAAKITTPQPEQPQPEPATNDQVLNAVASWLERFIKPAQPGDLQTLTLWAVHTHLVKETHTTPRLLLDSAAPESGKTTTLDHLSHLCFKPAMAASLSSPALLARLVANEPRTILVDEAEKNLSPKNDGVGEMLAVLNSGYKFGATRPVLTQQKVGDTTEWVPVEMSTYSPVAMAGNSPDLPDDTRSRCIRVLLLPDLEGTVEDSIWEDITDDANQLHDAIAAWADQVRDQVKGLRPDYSKLGLPKLRGRNRERWSPLYKVAEAAGGKWPKACLQLIAKDLEQQQLDREEGLQHMKRHVLLLRDIASVWPKGGTFLPTSELIRMLKFHAPDFWGMGSHYGELKAQGFGRMLVNNFNIRSSRLPDGDRARGYYLTDFQPAFKAFGLVPTEPDVPDEAAKPD